MPLGVVQHVSHLEHGHGELINRHAGWRDMEDRWLFGVVRIPSDLYLDLRHVRSVSLAALRDP